MVVCGSFVRLGKLQSSSTREVVVAKYLYQALGATLLVNGSRLAWEIFEVDFFGEQKEFGKKVEHFCSDGSLSGIYHL